MDSRRISEFIRQYIPRENGGLERLREKAEKNGVPVIRLEAESFLQTVLIMTKPERVLELGTAVGYSAIFMADAGRGYEPGIISIDTIEDWNPRITEAASNIKNEGYEDKINLIEGDALEVMKTLAGPYDLVFIDAAKGQYPDYFDETMRLTEKGSVILADNIFMDGEILESKYSVKRRDRTIHKRIREFLDKVTGDERLQTTIIPIGDGMTLSVRLK